MKGQGSDLFFPKQFEPEDVPDEIDHKETHDRFKPPGIIDPFSGGGRGI